MTRTQTAIALSAVALAVVGIMIETGSAAVLADLPLAMAFIGRRQA